MKNKQNMNFTLTGFRTYIIGTILVLFAIAVVLKIVSVNEFLVLTGGLMGLGFITIRKAIANGVKAGEQ